jgi:hypothetical protein
MAEFSPNSNLPDEFFWAESSSAIAEARHFLVMVPLLIVSRSQAQKDLKGNWTIAIRGIECGRFRIES